MRNGMKYLVLAMLSVVMTGCTSIQRDKIYVWAWEATHQTEETQPPVTPTNAPPVNPTDPVLDQPVVPPTPPPVTTDGDGAIPAGCLFVGGADVSAWPVTAKLTASVNRGKITLKHDKVNIWPANGDGLNANPWIIAEFGGKWYAGNWEWIRKGQTLKDMSGKTFGSHVKASPFPNDWNPAPGQRIGLMVSALSRGSSRSVKERTDVVWVKWP